MQNNLTMNLEEKTKFVQEVKNKLYELTILVNNWEVESSMVGEIIIDEDTYITEYHAARFLDISQKTLNRRAKDGDLPYSKQGRTTMYKIKDLRVLLDNSYIKGTQKSIDDIILGHIRYVKQRNSAKIN